MFLNTLINHYTPADRIASTEAGTYNRAMLTSLDLQACIDTHGIQAEIVRARTDPGGGCATVAAAAQAMGVPTDSIVKSVLFVIRRTDPLLIIVNGERRIDQRTIARRLGLGRKQVKMATPAEVLAWTGFPVGAVPPFGHAQPLLTWVDPSVLEQGTILGGGGEASALVRMKAADLILVTHAEVVTVCG
ncbi:MAG: hypothetical protein KAS81_03415 [Anaerolineales bacterium]|nr:hypothetical protein [Anaerolineales bacterium]